MTALVDDVNELLILIPYLGEALERDAGGSGDPVSSGATDPAFRLPVNADVLAAVHHLDRTVPRIAEWAAGVVAEPARQRTIAAHVYHFSRWHERMLVTAATTEAAQLAAGVNALLWHVKIALGLRTPDRRLGQYCPLHDDPLHELITPGDVATLRLNRGRPTAVVWERPQAARCSSCGAEWRPAQYLTLARLLREADARRYQAARTLAVEVAS